MKTNNELNEAIALKCGWKRIEKPENEMEEAGHACMRKEYWDAVYLPRYCQDLNAVHEAEKTLTDDQYELFGRYLCKWSEKEAELSVQMGRMIVSAPSRQRAEAFCRAVGIEVD